MTYVRRVGPGAPVYLPEFTVDMKTWISGTEVQVEPIEAGWERVTTVDMIAEGKNRFGRLTVTGLTGTDPVTR